MPQLPSGRHIAVKFDEQFSEALNNTMQDVRSVWMFMPVETERDMYPWVRILWLLPEETAQNPIADHGTRTMQGSLQIPGGLVECESGYRLHQADTMMATWSAEDRCAFEAFVSGRLMQHMLMPAMETIRQWKAWIPSATNMVMRMCYLWWLNDCHPAQEEQWQYDDPAPQEIDSYDLLATLDHFMRLIQAQELQGEMPDCCNRLRLFITGLHHSNPAMQQWQSGSIKEQAKHCRNNGVLENLSEVEAEALKKQAISEAIALWQGFTDDALRKLDLTGWKILQLVVVAKDFNEI